MLWVAFRMLTGDRVKYLGLIFGIAFATLLIAQQSAIFANLMLRVAAPVYDAKDVDVWVMDPRTKYLEEIKPMSGIEVDRVRGVPGVAWAVRFFKGNAIANLPGGTMQTVFLYGFDDANRVGVPSRVVMGDLDDLAKPDSVAIDQDGYRQMWPGEPLELGRSMELNDRRAIIVAIVEASPPFTTLPNIYTRYSRALTYSAGGRERMSFVLARAAEGQTAEAVATRIKDETGLQARTRDQFAWQAISWVLNNTGIPINFGATIGLGFIVGVAIVGLTFSLFIHDNIKQFAAVKAFGVNNLQVMGMVGLQGLLIAFVGYGLGMGLTALFFAVSSQNIPAFAGFYLQWQIMAGTALAVVVIVVAAGFASLRKVLVTDPAVVFRG
jgi:putative ABC transport system permease protein